jgi:hypothetical protein
MTERPKKTTQQPNSERRAPNQDKDLMALELMAHWPNIYVSFKFDALLGIIVGA